MLRLYFSLVFSLLINYGSAQNVGVGTTTPHSSAILDLTSTDKGLLVPRMTGSQRLAITPVNGLIVFDTDTASLFVYAASEWKKMPVKKLEDFIVGSNFGDMLRWNGSTSWEAYTPTVPVQYPLTISRTGSGTVTSSVTGVYCGLDCAESYNSGTSVTLTATPDPGANFVGWSGSCSGTGSCVVTMTAARNVTASFTHLLTVSKSGSGTGTVTSTPAGINCGSTCSANYSNGSLVTLSAGADANAAFTGWAGACTGTGPCTVTMDAAKNVTAFFTRQQYLLAVSKNGTGSGTITSSPAGISCGAACNSMYDGGTSVTLSASPDGNSSFAGWSGACTGTGICVVTMDALKNVVATFTKPQYTLTTSRTGPGTVISSPSGIICQPACSDNFESGTSVTLTPVPDQGSSFGNWSGDCSGSFPSCVVSVNGNKNVAARFGYLLTTSGPGGTISSSPTGISCGATCNYVFNPGTVVTLTATPNANGTFTGWSGACSGTGLCVVTMNAAASVSAFYSFPLNVTRYNNGGGSVFSSPSGISCGTGGACTTGFINGTNVSLTASPDAGAGFVGWSGDCTGSGACNVSMNTVRNVQAIFSYPLTVTKNAASAGTVSSPSGFNCGTGCSNQTLSSNYNDVVILTATPAAGATFVNWTGCDAPSGNSCTMNVSAIKTVQANFAYPVTASVTNASGGNVASSPAGINCPSTCNALFTIGSLVSLTPNASAGATFNGWTGCDAVVGSTCNLTINSPKNVVAQFTYPLTVTNNSGGSVTGSPAGINCPGTCTSSYTAGSSVTLTPTPAAGAAFGSWTGCDGVSGNVCTINMNSVRNATATFTYPLTVTKSGAGTGTVTSSPTGINCGATCTASYPAGSNVILTATPAVGSVFGVWTNCPSPSGNSCTVPMTQIRTVNASFN